MEKNEMGSNAFNICLYIWDMFMAFLKKQSFYRIVEFSRGFFDENPSTKRHKKNPTMVLMDRISWSSYFFIIYHNSTSHFILF